LRARRAVEDIAAVSDEQRAGPTWERLESQITWYDKNAGSNQQWYKWLKVLQIVLAAAIPASAAAGAGAAVAGVMGGLIVTAEGTQQLFQFQPNWTNYRATCEALKREKFLFLAGAGDYTGRPDAEQLLAMRVETLVSNETANWSATQQEQGSGAPRSADS
jgi:Protein of unknown function (DUF4231)